MLEKQQQQQQQQQQQTLAMIILLNLMNFLPLISEQDFVGVSRLNFDELSDTE